MKNTNTEPLLRPIFQRVADPLELATKKIENLAVKIEKTREVLEQISAIPEQIKVRVSPGSITFKLEDEEVSFKDLVENIKQAFRIPLHKDFSETNGRYSLVAKVEGVKIKIANIPPPEGCNIQMREVTVTVKKKEFLPFGACEAIVK